MSVLEGKQVSLVERKILRLIPAARGKMVSEIALVNLAFFKEGIQPFATLQIVRELLRDGVVYQPRNDLYKKV